MPTNFTVLDLLNFDSKDTTSLNLTCVAGRKGLSRIISQPDINRPGLALGGFFDGFNSKRLQLFGNGECAYLRLLSKENRWKTVEQIFSYCVPGCIFTSGHQPEERLIEIAEAHETAVLVTFLNSSDLTLRLVHILGDVFSPQRIIHGVLCEVFGMGVLLQGNSGVGKSEAALELIERGHRLVCDDAVDVRHIGSALVGKPVNPTLGHHLEVRGIGVINVAQLFGISAIQFQKEVEIAIELEIWDQKKEYERLGTQTLTIEILGVRLPAIKIPIKPGRNIAIIIETAVMDHRLKKMGYHSAQRFHQNIVQWLESENARNIYLRKNKNNPYSDKEL